MHPLRFPRLADENIHEAVVRYLREQKLDIESIKERNLRGISDNEIIALAQAEKKVILTHDADFGRSLHFSQGVQTGVIFLRPGHIDYSFTIQTLKSILATEMQSDVPFIMVAERTGNDIKIRLRNL